MLKKRSIYSNRKMSNLFMLMALMFVSHALFAVDGIISKSRSSKSSFSNMKKNLTLTLHSGFSLKDNKSFGFRNNGKENSFNSLITYQKGNINYMIPYRNKAILQKFATPQKPVR